MIKIVYVCLDFNLLQCVIKVLHRINKQPQNVCDSWCVVAMLQKMCTVRCNKKWTIKVQENHEKNWHVEIVFSIVIP